MRVRKIITVIQVLLILVFISCGLYVGKYFYDAHEAQEQFDTLKTEVEQHTYTDASGSYEERYAKNGMLREYYELYQKNNDMVGWLKIDDTVIDYPVVQAKDNEYYLHRDFYKKSQFSGTPFLDCDCTEGSLNKIIYAHNMKNGTMFAAISKYDDKNYFDAHKKIRYNTLYERGKYDIISVFRTTVGSKNEFKYHEYADIENEDKYNEYINKVKSLSLYDTGVDAAYGDALLTLSTCAYHTSNERIVVVARKRSK